MKPTGLKFKEFVESKIKRLPGEDKIKFKKPTDAYAYAIFLIFRKTPHTISDVLDMYITQLMVIVDMLSEEIENENKAVEDSKRKHGRHK